MPDTLFVLTRRQCEIVDYMVIGYNVREISRLAGIKEQSVRTAINQAAVRIGGCKVRALPETFRERALRCVVWRAKQLGVIEHYAGLRDQYGVRLEEYEVPSFTRLHPHHDMLFPSRQIG